MELLWRQAGQPAVARLAATTIPSYEPQALRCTSKGVQTLTQQKVRVGIVGCGIISSIYLEAPGKFDILEVVACADIDMNRARAQAQKYNIPNACTVDELLADPDIDIVLNLTIPRAHAEIAQAALHAGKSTYSEKPLAINRAEGKAILDL